MKTKNLSDSEVNKQSECNLIVNQLMDHIGKAIDDFTRTKLKGMDNSEIPYIVSRGVSGHYLAFHKMVYLASKELKDKDE